MRCLTSPETNIALWCGSIIPTGSSMSGLSARTGRPGARRKKAWPYCHIDDTYNHMKTTLNIADTVMAEIKREAARQGRTMSELVETALRLLLRSQRKREKIVALPSFHSGGALVDIADRDALYQAMEGR